MSTSQSNGTGNQKIPLQSKKQRYKRNDLPIFRSSVCRSSVRQLIPIVKSLTPFVLCFRLQVEQLVSIVGAIAVFSRSRPKVALYRTLRLSTKAFFRREVQKVTSRPLFRWIRLLRHVLRHQALLLSPAHGFLLFRTSLPQSGTADWQSIV